VDTNPEIESSGNDVEAAITAGLEALDVERDAVRIEVLDEGSRGLLGIGARPARVRLTVETAPALQEKPSPAPISEPATEHPPSPAAQAKTTVPEAVSVEEASVTPDKETDELQNMAPIARQTLEELLGKMEMRAHVEDYVKAPQEKDDYPKLVLNVQGKDLGILIGRRGETLNALQYLTRLIVGREVQRRVNVVVDVEGYRTRRERSLQQLAKRMAERAVATGRRQVLEPMSPAERRIVHVALRHHPDVITESIGQGESRKVTICLRGSK
jgi:spoIIIJ-associated protein